MSETTTTLREKIVVVIPEIRVWTGTRAMHESDYNIGADGELPPKQAVASYGLKSIIDPVVLKPFSALKNRADTLLEGHSVRFLGGWALRKGQIAENVCRELDSIKQEYETLKTELLANYDNYVEDWARRNPSFASQILSAKLDPATLSRKLSADYEVIAIAPAVDGPRAEEFDKKVESGLTAELIRSINVAAKKYLRDSFDGRSEATQRILSTMRKIHSRLVSLEFLSGNIAPLSKTIATVISACPKQGLIEGANFWILRSIAQTLASESQLAGIIEGRINCDELLVQSRKALSGATTEGSLLAVQEPKKAAKRSAKKADIIAEISEFFDANLDDGQSVPRKATQADELPVVQPPQQQSEEMPAGFYF